MTVRSDLEQLHDLAFACGLVTASNILVEEGVSGRLTRAEAYRLASLLLSAAEAKSGQKFNLEV